MKNLIILLLILPFVNILKAQETGSFVQSVEFNEADYNFTRNLYYHVPADYSPDNSYKLVVGFRGGPHSNAGQFRTQLQFLSDSIGAIVVCPENADHFWNEEGQTKQLFKYSVEHVSGEYNIDPAYIYLTGLSYGGRHAVIVAMDTDDGEIPAIRGVIPFAAGSEADLQPNYDSIDDFAPACICIGLSDANNFINVSNNLHDDIQANNGLSILNEIPNVGHTVAFSSYPAEMMECLNWIEEQYVVPSSIVKQESLALQIGIYPNPTSRLLNLEIAPGIQISSIELFDSNGSLTRQYEGSVTNINIENLSAGNYLLIFKSDSGNTAKKFTVLEE